MICEVCGAEANVHLTVVRGGRKFRHDVCERHAVLKPDGSLPGRQDKTEADSSAATSAAATLNVKTAPGVFSDSKAIGDAR